MDANRSGFGAAISISILSGVALAWWFLWVPNWRPPIRDGETYGVDVSAHQGLIDWHAVAGDSVDFAYIKATEGRDFVDEHFAENWAESRLAGVDRGAYHFFTLCSPGDSQARHFLRIAPPDPHSLAPAVDLELAGNCATRPNPEDVAQELNVFLDRVEEAWGEKVLLYVGDDWEALYPVRTRLSRPLWLRRFLFRPRPPIWRIWQLHGYARVNGISGSVDLNVMRDTGADE